MANTMPVVFIGHGNPLNALSNNAYTEGWAAMAAGIPGPAAVLAVSAHWYVRETAVTAMAEPRTIHDFGGFPPELYEVQYPAPGSAEAARRVSDLLTGVPVRLDEQWGLDHGTWSVLRRMYPNADVPVIQLSIDRTQPHAYHHEIGRRLAALRDEGILILGSGNLVHNLHAYAWGVGTPDPYDWAVRFESQARELLVAGDDEALVAYESLGPDADLAIPTPDHYLPLLYVVGARRKDEPVTFPVEGVDGGSVSMLAVRMG